MKPKTMILLVMAVTCGLGASYMTSRLLAERTQEAPETVKVLVARKEMPTGTSITNPPDAFIPKEYVRGTEPKDAIESYDQIKGRVLKQRLREGDHVRAEDLMSDKDALMQHLLQKGYRAIGLRVSIESIAGGFAALPLSRVDIISTVRRGDEGKSHSTTLLQNVLVLAADQQTVADGKGALPATTVTVALKPEDVQKVNLAKEMGQLSLALRAFGDDKRIDLAATTGDSLYGDRRSESEGPALNVKPEVVPEVKPEAPTPEQEAPKFRYHVTIITNGNKQDRVEFKLDENNQVISSRLLPQEGAVVPRLDPPSTPPAMPPLNPAVPPQLQPPGATPNGVPPGQATPVPPNFF
ncbi:MAG: Flp pilus assembly protein CpaB [Planctomycetes bacterium]|nr:Flp pilus assembly protein CpaB [Planctomycetota bacterium]